MSAGTVYVIQAGAYFKIGRTRDLVHRLSSIQADSPRVVKLIYQLETADSAGLERFLHQEYAPMRARGGREWYALTRAALEAIRAIQCWPDPTRLHAHAVLSAGPMPRGLRRGGRACHCLRCQYRWTPYHGRRPRRCARCRSPYWDVPRREDEADA
jgi:Meiotically up-regulated gene 113